MIFNVAQHTLSDIRDGNTYTVRKLADGNCWMTENLALGTVGVDLVLDSNNSDLSGSVTIPSTQFQTTDGMSWSSQDVFHIYIRDKTTYGNLYNWYTATAGTGTSSVVNTIAPGSICPKGWILPRNQSSTEYYLGTLLSLYSINTNGDLPKSPWSGQLTGGYNITGLFISQPQAAHYWYANAAGSTYAYFMGNNGPDSSSTLILNHNSWRTMGFDVRCVASR